MKKFVFLYCGLSGAADAQAEWISWFDSIAESLVDGGNPFAAGRYVGRTGVTDLAVDDNSIIGYSIVSAPTLEDAERIAAGSPAVSGVQVFEALPM